MTLFPNSEYESDRDVEVEEEDVTKKRPGKKHKDILVCVIDLQDELRAKIYTDQAGKFPLCSSKDNQYLMIMCKMDSDSTLMEPTRDRIAGEMVESLPGNGR